MPRYAACASVSSSSSNADFGKVQTGYLLVEVLRQHIHLVLVLIAVRPQLNLRQRLVGEGVGHYEGRVAGGAAQVHQAAFSQYDDVACRQCCKGPPAA